MKVFILSKNPYTIPNPYIYTLMDSISSRHEDVEWFWGSIFSKELDDCDLIHIHWPNMLVELSSVEKYHIEEAEKRLLGLKKKGLKIVATCHNLEPHYSKDSATYRTYSLVYSNCDIMIHLDRYSNDMMLRSYPQAEHIIIPHHFYDTVYNDKLIDRNTACRQLGIDPEKKYILCFGSIRSDEERQLIINTSRGLDENIEFLVPGFVNTNNRRNKLLLIKPYLKAIFYNLRYNFHLHFGYVDDELLSVYFAACDIVLVPRVRILNSGNVFLATYFGKYVVGPEIGNVGCFLTRNGYKTFNVERLSDIPQILKATLESDYVAEGMQKKADLTSLHSTQIVAEQIYRTYVSLITGKV